MGYYLSDANSSPVSTWRVFSSTNFKTVNAALLIKYSSGDGSLLSFVATANTPQALSAEYIMWNGQIARFWGEHEWRSYLRTRKVARVSYGANVPGFRDSRSLQLPYWLSAIYRA